MKTFKRIGCGAVMLIILIIIVASILILSSLFIANTTEIEDAFAFQLIQKYFEMDISRKSEIVYKTYGTNIREEFFTIIVMCYDSVEVENKLYDEELIIGVKDFVANYNLRDVSETFDSNTEFNVRIRHNRHGHRTHLIAISDDKKYIVFDYDP